MTASGNDEVDRIMRTVERAFGNRHRQPLLQLDRAWRLSFRRSGRGSVTALFGVLMALAAGAGFLAGRLTIGPPHDPPPPAVVRLVPDAAVAPLPAPTATQIGSIVAAPPASSPPPSSRPPRRVAVHHIHSAPPRAKQPPPSISPPPPDLMADEKRQREIEADRIMTRALNRAELRRAREGY